MSKFRKMVALTLFPFKIKEQGAPEEGLLTSKDLTENMGLKLGERNSMSLNLPKRRVHRGIRCHPWHTPALYSARQGLREPKLGLGTVT